MRLAKLAGDPAAPTPHPEDVTVPGAGGKFDPDGNVLPFPGNTFLCHLDRTSTAYQAVAELRDALLSLPSAGYFTFLPAPSLHMTVFCGISGTPLGSDGWPADVPPGATLDAITARFRRRLDGVNLPERVHVTAQRLDTGRAIAFAPADARSRDDLRTIRSTLRDVTGLHRPDQESYEFHMSLGYLKRFMPHAEAEEHLDAIDAIFEASKPHLSRVSFGPVEYCTFENMLSFTPTAIVGGLGPRPV